MERQKRIFEGMNEIKKFRLTGFLWEGFLEARANCRIFQITKFFRRKGRGTLMEVKNLGASSKASLEGHRQASLPGRPQTRRSASLQFFVLRCGELVRLREKVRGHVQIGMNSLHIVMIVERF